jgi:hypothetical protein
MLIETVLPIAHYDAMTMLALIESVQVKKSQSVSFASKTTPAIIK